MSIPKKMTVKCSKCGKPLSATVFESVNSDYAKDIAMQIMSGDLFNVECPHCKFVSHLEYDILYHDLQHGAMIWVVHKSTPEYAKKIAEVRTAQKLPYKTLRIVDDMNALKEKVSCLESNRDDRIIELCKVFTVNNLLSQRPDFDFRNAFYTAISGKELIYLFDNDNNELCCELPDKAYDYIKDLYYGSHYATQFDDNYPIVDYEWAESVLIPLIEAEADKLSSTQEDDITESSNNTSTSNNKVCPKCKAVLPNDSEFCQLCGTKLSSATVTENNQLNDKGKFEHNQFNQSQNERKNNISVPKSNTVRKNSPNNKLVSFTNISSVVLMIISMLSIIIALNAQDVRRNDYEEWNPTIVYFILLLIFGAFLGIAINSLLKKRFKLIACLSPVPVIAAIIPAAEGSIMERGYRKMGRYESYYHSEIVDIFNFIWFACAFLVLFITLIPVIVEAIKKINNNWHKSISYREKCYKRVAKIHSYLEKGIITEEEYEKTKSDILKYIQ